MNRPIAMAAALLLASDPTVKLNSKATQAFSILTHWKRSGASTDHACRPTEKQSYSELPTKISQQIVPTATFTPSPPTAKTKHCGG